VYTAKYLQRRLPADWKIILLSEQNHTVFTPLLGDVVGSSINPMHVVWPMRQVLRRVECRTAVATNIDFQRREVEYETSAGQRLIQPYEHLVIACGSVVNLDIMPGMAAHGWPLKTVGDALALRNHVIGMLEEAEVETDAARKRRLLGIAVVGGGFSGVEVAGELYDLVTSSSRFYPHLKADQIKVVLLEGRSRILPELPESL
jgi:NADH dehydrogenase